MVFNREEIVSLYRKRAKRYDWTANLYYLMGFREWRFRKMAVQALRLQPGDTVVEIGCGTGLNFSLLEREIGPEGKIIGVDLTDSMLNRARQRIEQRGRRNVELVQTDAASYPFPTPIQGILSTFALTLVPEFDAVIQSGAEALDPGRRWVVLDLKLPSGKLAALAPLILPAVRPFGVTLDLTERHPWEAMARHTANFTMQELFFGFAYLAVGAAPNRGRPVVAESQAGESSA